MSFFLLLNLAWAIGFDFDNFPLFPIKPIDPIMSAIYYGERANFGLYFFIVDCPIFAVCMLTWWVGAFHGLDIALETPEEEKSRILGNFMAEQGQAIDEAKYGPSGWHIDYREKDKRKSAEEAEKRFMASLNFGVHRNKERDSDDRRMKRANCGDCYRLEHGYGFGFSPIFVCPRCGHFYRKKCSCIEDYNLKKELKILFYRRCSKVFLVLGIIMLVLGCYIYLLAMAYSAFSFQLFLTVSVFYLIPLMLSLAFHIKYRAKMQLLSQMKNKRLEDEK
jgi:hypothetical protein